MVSRLQFEWPANSQVRRRIQEAAESALAKIEGKLEQKRVADIVEKAGSEAVFLDQPVVILPLKEYQSLLAQAGRKSR